MKSLPLLLTATVDPQGMKGADFAVEERLKMYVESIRFYLSLGLTLVVVENSGEIDRLRKAVEEPGVEWIDASGCDYLPDRGKGYNEMIEIRHALQHSSIIAETQRFMKVTGRLRILNVERLMREVLSIEGLRFMADCKDHSLYEWLHLPINGHAGECRYWYSTVDFFEAWMWPLQPRLMDYGNQPYLAEDAMLEVCRRSRSMKDCRDRFRTQARLSGRGAHHLGQGIGFFYSTDNDSLALRFKSSVRQWLRWLMPWWRC